MKYAQHAHRPDWYESDDNKIYAQAISGSSPFNEWYEFDDRADALELIASAFKAGSFEDRFVWYHGEIYEYDEFTPESLHESDNSGDYVLKKDAWPAYISDMVEAESRF